MKWSSTPKSTFHEPSGFISSYNMYIFLNTASLKIDGNKVRDDYVNCFAFNKMSAVIALLQSYGLQSILVRNVCYANNS